MGGYAYKPNFNFLEMAHTICSPLFENSIPALRWNQKITTHMFSEIQTLRNKHKVETDLFIFVWVYILYFIYDIVEGHTA